MMLSRGVYVEIKNLDLNLSGLNFIDLAGQGLKNKFRPSFGETDIAKKKEKKI